MKLIIAEKPSLARNIAKALGANSQGNGFLFNQKDDIYVTWAFGHIYELKTPEKMNESWGKWNLTNLPMLPKFDIVADYLPKGKDENGKDASEQISALMKLIGEADEIYHAGDPDREGELITREIVAHGNKKSGVKEYRMWFNEMGDDAIRKEFEKKRPASDYDNLFKCALQRQQGDWLVGMNMTQLYSLVSKSKGSDTLSVGRVQTAIVSIISEREDEITSFKPEKFHRIKAEYKDFSGEWFDEEHKDGMIKEEPVFNKVFDAVKDAKEANVVSVERQKKEEYVNGLYDLAGFQADASRKLGITLDKSMEYAQKFYETYKIMSYPRTDSQYVNNTDFQTLKKAVLELKDDGDVGYDIIRLEKEGNIKANDRFVDDARVTAHSGLYPISNGRLKQTVQTLSGDEKEAFLLIVRRCLACMSPAFTYEATSVIADINGQSFKTNGRAVLSKGWKEVFDDSDEDDKKKSDVIDLSGVAEGQILPVKKVKNEEKETKPPKRYTEADMIKILKSLTNLITDNKELSSRIKAISGKGERELGLGTPATRKDMLKKICDRGYVEMKGKSFVPTEKAKKLLSVVDDAFKSPIMTAIWEDKLKKIELGEYDADLFRSELNDAIKTVVEARKASGPGKCQKCGGTLVERDSAKGSMIVCSNATYVDGKKGGCDHFHWLGKYVDTGVKCEVCGKRVIDVETPNGKKIRKCESSGWDAVNKKAFGCGKKDVWL